MAHMVVPFLGSLEQGSRAVGMRGSEGGYERHGAGYQLFGSHCPKGPRTQIRGRL